MDSQKNSWGLQSCLGCLDTLLLWKSDWPVAQVNVITLNKPQLRCSQSIGAWSLASRLYDINAEWKVLHINNKVISKPSVAIQRIAEVDQVLLHANIYICTVLLVLKAASASLKETAGEPAADMYKKQKLLLYKHPPRGIDFHPFWVTIREIPTYS